MTERMLIRHLHEMVEDGIILRHDKRSIPPHVSYSISSCGMTLAPVLEKICEWGWKHQARLKNVSSLSHRRTGVVVQDGIRFKAGSRSARLLLQPAVVKLCDRDQLVLPDFVCVMQLPQEAFS
jgi:hypothetical protein